GQISLSNVAGSIQITGDAVADSPNANSASGVISLVSNSNLPFVIGANTANGVTGSLQVLNNTVGASVIVQNNGNGGITLAVPANLNGALGILATPTGPIRIVQGVVPSGLLMLGKTIQVVGTTGGDATAPIQ